MGKDHQTSKYKTIKNYELWKRALFSLVNARYQQVSKQLLITRTIQEILKLVAV